MAITTNGGAGVTADAVATLSNKTLEAPVINNATFTGAQSGLEVAFSQYIVFEGATADAYETTLSAGEPTADRTITLPDSTGTVALTSDLSSYITASSTDTLTNKTITSPVVSGLTLSDASIILEGATADAYETTLTVTDPTADRTITFQDATGTVVLRDSTDTLTNKTLTSPVVNTAILKSPEERLTVSATAADTTVNFDTLTQGVLYYTSDATANWTLNVRGDGSTTLNDSLTTGDSITIVFLATQGATAYYSSALTIDGSAVTPKYISGTAFSAGNASSIDSYVYTIIKTGSATFTVLASQTKFA